MTAAPARRLTAALVVWFLLVVGLLAGPVATADAAATTIETFEKYRVGATLSSVPGVRLTPSGVVDQVPAEVGAASPSKVLRAAEPCDPKCSNDADTLRLDFAQNQRQVSMSVGTAGGGTETCGPLDDEPIGFEPRPADPDCAVFASATAYNSAGRQVAYVVDVEVVGQEDADAESVVTPIQLEAEAGDISYVILTMGSNLYYARENRSSWAIDDLVLTPTPTLVLTSTPGDGRAGTPVELTAKLANVDVLGGRTVSFRADGEEVGRSTTDDQGVATYSHPYDGARDVELTAMVDVNDRAVTSNPVEHEWWFTDLRVEPEQSQSRVGAPFTLTATLTRELEVSIERVAPGAGAPGRVLYYTIVSDTAGVERIEDTVTTGEDGSAKITWERSVPSVDTITVSEVALSGPTPTEGPSALPSPERVQVSHRWLPPAPAITLEQSPPDSRVGTEVVLTARLTNVSEPQGISVQFRAGEEVIGSIDADENGVATLRHRRDRPGRERLTASAVIGEGSEDSLVSAPVTHVWWTTRLVVAPLNSRSPINAPFTVTATLTQVPVDSDDASRAGDPVPGQEVSFRAENSLADQGDEIQRARTDASGAATFTWDRSEPSSDTVTVRELADVLPASARTTHRWSEQEPPPTLVIAASSTASRIGTTVTLRASVSALVNGRSTPLPGRSVQFLADGQVLNPTPVVTDARGVATLERRRDTEGREALTAKLVNSDAVSAPSPQLWFVPELELTPLDARTTLGDRFTVTAFLSRPESPPGEVAARAVGVAGELELTVRDSVSGVADFVERKKTVNGRATFTWSRRVARTETVSVRELAEPRPATATTGHAWVPRDARLSLQQSSPSSRLGSPVTLTAALTLVGLADTTTRAGVPVAFSADGVVIATSVTDARGVATLVDRGRNTGSDSFAASASLDGATVPAPAVSHRWWLPDLVLAPRDATSDVGETFRLTATLTGPDGPLRGQPLRFDTSRSGRGLDDRSDTLETNAQGRATITSTSDVPGVDSVTVREVGVPRPASASTRHTWVEGTPPEVEDRELTLVASPTESSGEISTDHTVRATVRFGGEPVAGVRLRMLATKTGSPDVDQTVRTDSDGEASFRYTRGSEGEDRIRVTASRGDDSVTRFLTRRWTDSDEAAPTLRITLGPPDAATVVGRSFRAVATVRRDGELLPDVAVRFRSTASGEPDITGSDTASSRGQATFSYQRDRAVRDRVTASATVDGETVSTGIDHRWTAAPPKAPPPKSTPPTPPRPPLVTVDPGTTSTQPGADLPISGTGCRPGQRVELFLGTTKLAETLADPSGNFSVRPVVPDLPLDRYTLRSSCGQTSDEVTLDLVAPISNSGSAAAAGVTTAGVLTFFLLLIGSVMQGTGGRVS